MALREELKQHGETLALLDELEEQIAGGSAEDVGKSLQLLWEQGSVVAGTQRKREQIQRQLARHFMLPNETEVLGLVDVMPSHYRPLVSALADEIRELPLRVQQRMAALSCMLSSRSPVVEKCQNGTQGPNGRRKLFFHDVFDASFSKPRLTNKASLSA
jgi:hypothetical protein